MTALGQRRLPAAARRTRSRSGTPSRKIRERLPERHLLRVVVLRAVDDSRDAVEDRRRQREAVAHAFAQVGDVLVEVARHVVQARDVVLVLLRRLRIDELMQLQQNRRRSRCRCSTACATPCSAPSVSALRHHELEQVVAHLLLRAQPRALDRAKPLQRTAVVRLQPPLLRGRRHRRQPVVVIARTPSRARGQRILAPDERALIVEQLGENLCRGQRGGGRSGRGHEVGRRRTR